MDTITYDLSDILPDDEFNYEITFRTVFNLSAGIQYCTVYCSTDLTSDLYTYCLCRYQNTSTINIGMSGGTVNAVVGTGRTLTILFTSTTTLSSFEIFIQGYRKIS